MAKSLSFDDSLRVPPQDIEAEKALLGSIMLKPEGMAEIADFITEDSFYTEKHKLIYSGMLELFGRNEPIDLLSLSSRLKEKKTYSEVGGASYLGGLVEIVPSAANLANYAAIIQKKAGLRRLINAAEGVEQLAYGEEEKLELDTILDDAEQKIFSVRNTATASSGFSKIKAGLDEAYERFNTLSESKHRLRGVPTGFTSLDNRLAGLQKADLVILAARPSVGKTTLALDIAQRSACKYGTRVGIFSLEMSQQQLVDRMLGATAIIDAWQLRTGKFTNEDDYSKMGVALDELSRAPIFVNDRADCTIMTIRSQARRLQSRNGLDLLIIDYLQLISPNTRYESIVQQVTEISRSLKALAKELNIPILTLSQLSRAVEHRQGEPRLADLRDSGSIEQDADVVMFIHTKEKYDAVRNDNTAKVIIAKHRNGPTGSVELAFHPKSVSFRDIERGDFGDLKR